MQLQLAKNQIHKRQAKKNHMKVNLADKCEQYSHVLVTFEVKRSSLQIKWIPPNTMLGHLNPSVLLLAHQVFLQLISAVDVCG